MTLPSIEQFHSIFNTPEASYNGAFLAPSATYTCMPSFRGRGIDTASLVPPFQQKLVDLRIPIQVVDHIQIDCADAINNRSFRGGGFLARMAQEYGPSLSFITRGSLCTVLLRGTSPQDRNIEQVEGRRYSLLS